MYVKGPHLYSKILRPCSYVTELNVHVYNYCACRNISLRDHSQVNRENKVLDTSFVIPKDHKKV